MTKEDCKGETKKRCVEVEEDGNFVMAKCGKSGFKRTGDLCYENCGKDLVHVGSGLCQWNAKLLSTTHLMANEVPLVYSL